MLTQDIDFSCSAAGVCTARAPGVFDKFRALQQLLNNFAGVSLIVDGKIGNDTTTALNNTLGPIRQATVVLSPADIAAQVVELTRELGGFLAQQPAAQAAPVEASGAIQNAIFACKTDPSSPTCTQARNLCKYVKGSEQAQLPGIALLCENTESSTWGWWLAAGVAVAAGVGGVIWYRRRRLGKSQPRALPATT